MKTNLFIVFLLGFMLAACSSDEESGEEMWLGRRVVTSAQCIILDEQGNDLLDPDADGYYDTERLRIYFVKDDGSTQLLYIPNSDFPYGVHYPDPEDQKVRLKDGIGKYFYMSMTLYDWDICSGADHSKVILQWNEHERDTLECELSDVCIKKVYLNGELAWKEYDVSPIWNEITPSPNLKLIKGKNTGR